MSATGEALILSPLSVYAVLFCRITLGVVFALAVLGKLRDMSAFRRSIAELAGMPTRMVPTIAWSVIAGEAAVVVLLTGLPLAGRSGFVVAALLLTAFFLVIANSLVRGRRVACNCFGQQTRPVSALDLIRNAVLIGCAVVGITMLSVDGQAARSGYDVEAAVLTGVIAITFTAVALRLHDIALVLRPAPKVREPESGMATP
jgi:uncharacterized membrane protein YphA (DoxX/SURF4 family)